MPRRKTTATPEDTESRLFAGDRAVQRLVAQSTSLMRTRVSLHAETSLGKQATPDTDRRLFQSLYRITDPRGVFKRCRELSTETGFIEWVLRVKKLLFNHGLKVQGVTDEGLQAEVKRLIGDIYLETLICNNAVVVWMADDETIPAAQVLDCEGLKYENQFGEETLTICYKARPLSEAQKTKLGERYAEALTMGREIVWGEGPGEGFKVMTNAKRGAGLGRPSLWAIFEDLAVQGLLVKGDWNAAWTAKDVIRQFKKGHDIKSGNMAGLPVHFLKATERDAIHKAVGDKAGAFDIVTNFDVAVEYPKFDFDFFRAEKYEGTRMRLMEWAGPVGTIYLSERNDDEALFTLLRAEMETFRSDVAGLFARIKGEPDFKAVVGATLRWSQTTLTSWQAITSFVNTMVGNGVMSSITGRAFVGLDEATENANMELQREKPENYMPVFEPHQAMLTNPAPTLEGGRPKTD